MKTTKKHVSATRLKKAVDRFGFDNVHNAINAIQFARGLYVTGRSTTSRYAGGYDHALPKVYTQVVNVLLSE